MTHVTPQELEAGLGHIRQSPADNGSLRMIVQRPGVDQRTLVSEGNLDVDAGLVGDSWLTRGSPRTPDGGPNPAAQVTIINARLIALLARTEDRWPLAGDQLVIDIDMSEAQSPARSPARHRFSRDRDLRRTAYRLRQIRPALRPRRPPLHQHPNWPGPAPPRRQHPRHPIRLNPSRRPRNQALAQSHPPFFPTAPQADGSGVRRSPPPAP